MGSRILHQTADAYDRAARTPYGRIRAPTPAGDGLRRAARLLSAYGYLTSDPSFRPIVLITRLAALTEAIAVLRETQHHPAQAAGALSAAERLYTLQRFYAVPPTGGPAARDRGHAGRRRIPGIALSDPGRCPRAYGTAAWVAIGISQDTTERLRPA